MSVWYQTWHENTRKSDTDFRPLKLAAGKGGKDPALVFFKKWSKVRTRHSKRGVLAGNENCTDFWIASRLYFIVGRIVSIRGRKSNWESECIVSYQRHVKQFRTNQGIEKGGFFLPPLLQTKNLG